MPGPAPLILVVVSVPLVSAALPGFPIYFWVRDKRRRGERVGALGMLGALMIGLIGLAVLLVCLLGRP